MTGKEAILWSNVSKERVVGQQADRDVWLYEGGVI